MSWQQSSSVRQEERGWYSLAPTPEKLSQHHAVPVTTLTVRWGLARDVRDRGSTAAVSGPLTCLVELSCFFLRCFFFLFSACFFCILVLSSFNLAWANTIIQSTAYSYEYSSSCRPESSFGSKQEMLGAGTPLIIDRLFAKFSTW